MKLLIITQKVDINDSDLGFFHHWLEKFSQNLEKAYVISLWQGEYHLPPNVVLHSLGKEKNYSKLRQILHLEKFLLEDIKDIDGIFAHMCPIYAVASLPLAKIFRKRLTLWYATRRVSWGLKLAEKCVDKILTASPESCRLKNSKKIEVIGHGIDTEMFIPKPQPKKQDFIIFSPGRISPVKDQETLINALDILINKMKLKDTKVKISGAPIEDYEREYSQKIKNLIKERGLENFIEFFEGVPFKEMPARYQNSDLVVNMSHTGSIDKVVLEAMASGCLVLTCNEAFDNILDRKYLFKKKDPQDLAEKIINLREAPKDENLREIVVKNHNLDKLIDKIILEFS